MITKMRKLSAFSNYPPNGSRALAEERRDKGTTVVPYFILLSFPFHIPFHVPFRISFHVQFHFLLEKVPQDLFHSVYFEYEENSTHDRLLSLNYAFCHMKCLGGKG